MQFHINGEQSDNLHFGEARTKGDTALIFRASKVVPLGDVYNHSGYPLTGAGNGGTLDGVIKFWSQTLSQIDETNFVIPGHWLLLDYQGLKDCIKMLTDIGDQIMWMIQKGASLDDSLSSAITAAYRETRGNSGLLLNLGYFSLTNKVVDR